MLSRRAISFMVVLLIVFSAYAADADKGNVSENNNILNFNTGHVSPYTEILNSVISEACKNIKYICDVTGYPSKRSLMLSNSRGDGEAARVKKIKTLAPLNTSNLVIVPESSISMELVIFTRGLDIKVNGWKSLDGYINSGRLGAKIIEKNLPAGSVFLAESKQLFKMLDSGRVDTVIEWKYAGLKIIDELGLKGVSALETQLLSVDFFPFVHKDHRAISIELAAAIAELKADGSYGKIKHDILSAHGLITDTKMKDQ
jgi:hypothetical protein